MKQLMFTVYDAKAECYLSPFTMRSVPEAIRAFGDSVSKPGTTIHDHPEDFFLYQVGSFDMATGAIEVIQPVSVASGNDFREVADV